MFQIFAFSLKKKKKNLSWTLAYFAIDNEMKLFFLALFLFISNKLHYHYNQQICICDSFLILSISLFPFYVFLVFLLFDKYSLDFQV